MATEQPTSSISTVQCGACGQQNGSDAKFCESCGQSLYENCPQCSGTVALSQKFCGSCGADLQGALHSRRTELGKKLAGAVAATKEHDYERAITLLKGVAVLTDFRFKQEAEQAKAAIEKVHGLRHRAIEAVNQKLLQVKEAIAGGNQVLAAELLRSIPDRLMNEDARKILHRIESFTSQVDGLDGEIRTAIEKKDWRMVGGLLDQMLSLAPEEAKYRSLAEKVAGKLVSTARLHFENGKYSTAIRQLESVPHLSRDASFEELNSQIHNVFWLQQQFDQEPYASPTLGRLAVRFSKDVPGDESARKLVKSLAAHLKQAPRAQRTHLPAWKADSRSWLGGDVAVLGIPTRFDLGDFPEMRAGAGRFSVALGLALQGLGVSRVSDHFGPKKKGLLSAFGRKKSNAVWGIDIGSASFKAVCLEKADEDDELLEVTDCFYEEFETPLCRPGVEVDPVEVIGPVVERFLEEREIEDAAVWVNLAASHVVSRFVRLPPLRDKEAMELLNRELDQKVPIAIEDLVTVRWVEELADDEIHGRPAIAVAARRTVFDERLDLMEELGLPVSGMQADTIAVVNFAAYEFADLWEREDDDDDRAVDDEQDGDPEEPDAFAYDDEEPVDPIRTRSIALLDCGAAATNLLIVSGEGHFSWTFETGGEDLTAIIARSTKSTHGEAEQLKRNPATLPVPFENYAPVEKRLDEIRVRVETVMADAMQQNTHFDIGATWCVGGGCLAHQWIRRLTLVERDEV